MFNSFQNMNKSDFYENFDEIDILNFISEDSLTTVQIKNPHKKWHFIHILSVIPVGLIFSMSDFVFNYTAK